MVKRMWIGVLFLFLHELVSLIINSQIKCFKGCEFYNEQVLDGYNSSIQIFYFSLVQIFNNTELNTTDCVSYCSSSIFTSDNTLM